MTIGEVVEFIDHFAVRTAAPVRTEYGSLVLLSGNLPLRTEVTSVRILSYIENGNLSAAAAVARCCSLRR